MAHSIELLLDPHSDAAIRSQWQALADAGLPSQLRVSSPTNRPHVTLVAAARISPAVDEALRALAGRLAFDCVVGAPLVFGPKPRGGGRHTLARLIVPSAELLALHAVVYRLALPHVDGQPYPHCRPGHWTPHVTLARRLTAAEIGPALAVVHEGADEGAGDGAGDGAARMTKLRRWDGDQRIDHILIG